MPNSEICTLIGKIMAFIEKHPTDGLERLENFLNGDTALIDTVDVAEMTGWTVPYINKLCRAGALPHIPGKPHKFVPTSLLLGLKRLQVGGDYGRKKSRTLSKRKL